MSELAEPVPPAGPALPLPITLGSLATAPRWVAWQTERRSGSARPTKVPYSPTGDGKAEADNPATWGPRPAAEARAARLPRPFGDGGVGIELGDLGDGRCIGGVDLDTCRAPDGTLAQWASDVIDGLESYTEVSPSDTGAKVFFSFGTPDLLMLRAAMGTAHGKTFKKRGGGEHPPAIELHVSNRYFAVTDRHLEGTPTELRLLPIKSLLWLIQDAGPAFAGADRADAGGGRDDSRSARAFRIACKMRREGKSFDQMVAALRADHELADWLADKGEANGGRELRRLWERAVGAEDRAADPEMLARPDMNVLRLHRRAPPPLPLEVFGERWRAWIEATADGAACAPDYVAAPLLAAASVLIGNARWAQATPTWTEPPHLWCGVVGDSGNGKSPGADCLLRHVLPELERRMIGDFPDRLRDWRAAAAGHEAAAERWKAEVKEATKRGNPPPLPPDGEAPAEPQAPRLRQSDVTIERVATLLASAAPKGVMVTRDELAGWLTGMTSYNEAGRAFWVEAYGGRPYRVERQKHPQPIDVPHLAVAVFGGTQPEKLAELMQDADDGLLARFIWFWPDAIQFRLTRTASAASQAIEALDRLRLLDPVRAAGGQPAQPVLVRLAEDALADLEAFARDMQDRQQMAGGLMRSALGKARGLALRLAVVIEYLWWCIKSGFDAPPSTITRPAFLAAAHLADSYLMPMAERVYGDAAARPENRGAATLARWIVRTKPAEVHVRTLQREVRLPGLGDAEAIHAAANVLVEAGWLTPPPGGAFQQRARAAYAVNSKVYEAAQ